MKLDNFCIIGISHSVVGDGNFARRDLASIGEKLYIDGRVGGYLSLSTCLREELYFHCEDNFDMESLAEENFYFYRGTEAINYLFKVICGLDSVIKGEDQILSQVRASYRETLDKKRSNKIINRVFHKAIELGKEFRNLSKIAENALSLEANSVKFLRERVGSFAGKDILIIGAGELNQGIINILQKEKKCSITLVNRSKEKALDVSTNYKIDLVGDYEKRYKYLTKADIIISATSAPSHIIDKRTLKENKIVLEEDKKLYLDLAVPRDIHEGIIRDEDSLYNLDDIWALHRKNSRNRDEAEKKYLYLLDQKLEELIKWSKYREELEKVC